MTNYKEIEGEICIFASFWPWTHDLKKYRLCFLIIVFIPAQFNRDQWRNYGEIAEHQEVEKENENKNIEKHSKNKKGIPT